MRKRWRIHPHDGPRVAELERAASVPSVVAQLLLCRGVDDPVAIRTFLDAKLSGLHNPDDLPGMRPAAERVVKAISAKRPIVIYGDYDADGMTATALLFNCFRMLGAEVSYYLPNR